MSLLHGVFLLTGWEPAPPVFTIHSPNGQVAYRLLVK